MKGTILYYGNFELPDKGASANRVVSNGKIFNELGYRVIFLGTNMTTEHFDGIKQTSFNEHMFEESYPLSTKRWVHYVFDADNVLELVGRFDDVCLVIAYNLPYAKFRSLKRLLKRKGISAVYDCTEWNDYAEGNIIKRWYKRVDLFQIKHKLDKTADGLIVISKTMERYYHHKNMVRIPPLIDIEDTIWHQTGEKADNKFEFCYAGAVGVKEALDLTIKAFCKPENNNAKLRIIGLTKQDVNDMYSDLSDAINDRRVVFMGQLSHEETVRYVGSCDCYVFLRFDNPRNQAGFPTKFVEAFSCGVPIITTDVSDIREYQTERVRILESLDEKEIADAMNEMRNMRFEGNKLNKTFDYRYYEKRTAAWLSSVIGGGE